MNFLKPDKGSGAEEHSKMFPPSGSKRWMLCPGSAELCKDLPDTSGPAAKEGTLLHAFCEKNVKLRVNELPVNYKSLDEKLAPQAELALDMVYNLCQENKAVIVGIEIWGSVPGLEEICGTADLVLWSSATKEIFVVDYKFGFREVIASNNSQLRIYSLIAIPIMRKEAVEHVTMCIIQPKVHETKPSIETVLISELNEWRDVELAPIYKGISDMSLSSILVPGEEQCQWCKAKVENCSKMDSNVSSVLDNDEVGDKDLGERLSLVPLLRGWCKAVEAEAMSQLEDGQEVTDHKLIRKRANRAWVDPVKTDKWLAARKIKLQDRTTSKIIGIPAAEKMVKTLGLSKKLNNAFERLIHKPEGKLSYARADDPRQEVVVESVEDALNKSYDFTDLI